MADKACSRECVMKGDEVRRIVCAQVCTPSIACVSRIFCQRAPKSVSYEAAKPDLGLGLSTVAQPGGKRHPGPQTANLVQSTKNRLQSVKLNKKRLIPFQVISAERNHS